MRGVFDRYGRDIFYSNPHREGAAAQRPTSRPVPARRGLVVEDATSGFVGAIVRVEKHAELTVVELEDRRGRRRSFPLGAGFWIDGHPVELVLPSASSISSPSAQPQRLYTASGSRAVEATRARVARASRIFVEGTHDAELIEHVWGDDLRVEGVVVEYLEGIDHLEAVLDVFSPTARHRVGVLADHLVTGSKEHRIAQRVMQRWPDAVLVLGHPYVDVWQAIRPERVGLTAWPDIPRGTDIKVGTLRALGWPHATREDIGLGWKRLLSKVRHYRDLDTSLLHCVEALIDFVTAPDTE